MTAKEYLNQAYRLDQRINSKLEQVSILRSLTQKITVSYESDPVSHTRNVSSLEDAILRLMESENELNADIDALVDMKQEVCAAIRKVRSPEYQLLLEQRYLCFKSWSEIAASLNLEERYVYKVHGRALQEIEKIIDLKKRHEKTV